MASGHHVDSLGRLSIVGLLPTMVKTLRTVLGMVSEFTTCDVGQLSLFRLLLKVGSLIQLILPFALAEVPMNHVSAGQALGSFSYVLCLSLLFNIKDAIRLSTDILVLLCLRLLQVE